MCEQLKITLVNSPKTTIISFLYCPAMRKVSTVSLCKNRYTNFGLPHSRISLSQMTLEMKMRQEKIKKYIRKILVEKTSSMAVSPFYSGVFQLGGGSRCERIPCSYFTVSCAIENTLSRVIASHLGHLPSRTSSLYANFLDLVVTNRIHYDNFPFIFVFPFRKRFG